MYKGWGLGWGSFFCLWRSNRSSYTFFQLNCLCILSNISWIYSCLSILNHPFCYTDLCNCPPAKTIPSWHVLIIRLSLPMMFLIKQYSSFSKWFWTFSSFAFLHIFLEWSCLHYEISVRIFIVIMLKLYINLERNDIYHCWVFLSWTQYIYLGLLWFLSSALSFSRHRSYTYFLKFYLRISLSLVWLQTVLYFYIFFFSHNYC